jgi:quercetin dioxygenase-like cupin family protein
VQRWDLMSIDAPDGMRDPVVLYQDNAARAVLIVLQPGQELGEHQVKEHAWIAVVDGSVGVTCGGETVDASRGALFRFDRAEPHGLASDEGARVLLMLAPWPGEGHYRGDGPAASAGAAGGATDPGAA